VQRYADIQKKEKEFPHTLVGKSLFFIIRNKFLTRLLSLSLFSRSLGSRSLSYGSLSSLCLRSSLA
jgi:hypothetical protein